MANSKLVSIGSMFKTMKSESRNCDRHGEYIAELIQLPGGRREMWTGCADCDKERVKREDEELQREAIAARRQSQIDAMLGRAAIPKRFLDRSLDNYQIELEGQQRAHRAVLKYWDNWEQNMQRGTSLIMCGNPGTGKTHLAVGVARKVMDNGGTAMFTRIIDMARSVKECYSKDSKRTERQVIQSFADPDLLILDEVGHQHGSDTERMILFDVINARYEECKPVILITNLTLNALREYLDERAQDRLREGDGRVIVFDWQSQRGNF